MEHDPYPASPGSLSFSDNGNLARQHNTKIRDIFRKLLIGFKFYSSARGRVTSRLQPLCPDFWSKPYPVPEFLAQPNPRLETTNPTKAER